MKYPLAESLDFITFTQFTRLFLGTLGLSLLALLVSFLAGCQKDPAFSNPQAQAISNAYGHLDAFDSAQFKLPDGMMLFPEHLKVFDTSTCPVAFRSQWNEVIQVHYQAAHLQLATALSKGDHYATAEELGMTVEELEA